MTGQHHYKIVQFENGVCAVFIILGKKGYLFDENQHIRLFETPGDAKREALKVLMIPDDGERPIVEKSTFIDGRRTS